MSEPQDIRRAAIDDAEAVARLAGQLGYPADTEAMRERLDRALAHEDAVVFVAEGRDADVVGWIHAAAIDMLECDRRCEILGLVVDDRSRRAGVGRRLVEAAERWAAERGVGQMAVRSNVVREASHPFYERLGYQRVKTQHSYRKALQGRRDRERR